MNHDDSESRRREWRKPVISTLKVPGWTRSGAHTQNDEDGLLCPHHVAAYHPSPP